MFASVQLLYASLPCKAIQVFRIDSFDNIEERIGKWAQSGTFENLYNDNLPSGIFTDNIDYGMLAFID